MTPAVFWLLMKHWPCIHLNNIKKKEIMTPYIIPTALFEHNCIYKKDRRQISYYSAHIYIYTYYARPSVWREPNMGAACVLLAPLPAAPALPYRHSDLVAKTVGSPFCQSGRGCLSGRQTPSAFYLLRLIQHTLSTSWIAPPPKTLVYWQLPTGTQLSEQAKRRKKNWDQREASGHCMPNYSRDDFRGNTPVVTCPSRKKSQLLKRSRCVWHRKDWSKKGKEKNRPEGVEFRVQYCVFHLFCTQWVPPQIRSSFSGSLCIQGWPPTNYPWLSTYICQVTLPPSWVRLSNFCFALATQKKKFR